MGSIFYRTGRAAILQGAVWDDKIPSFPLLLRDSGYHIGETYKVWTPGTPRDAPFGAGKYGFEKAGGRFNGFSQNVSRMVNDGQSVKDAKQVLYDEVSANFECSSSAVGGQAVLLLVRADVSAPQWIQGSGKKLWGIDPASLKGKLPGMLPDVPIVREDFADYLGEVQAFDHALGLILKRLSNWASWITPSWW